MRLTLPIVAGTALLTAVALASTGPASATDNTPQTTQLRYRILFHDDFIDLGVPGPSAGDETVVHDTLVTPAGVGAGHDGGVCTFTDVTVPEANCLITFSLPLGQITTQFLNTPPPTKIGAITGGTGAYRHAHGQITLHEDPDQTGTIDFSLDR
jgi:hypothetical protein